MNKNPKTNFKKGDPKVTELAKKGGEAKKGHVSIKSALKRALDSGRIDVDELVDHWYLNSKENPSFAKLITEYVDGKIKDEVEVTTTINPAAQALKDIRANLDK